MVDCGDGNDVRRACVGGVSPSSDTTYGGWFPYWTGDILSKYFPSPWRVFHFSWPNLISRRRRYCRPPGSIFHQTISPRTSRSLIPSVTLFDISIYVCTVFDVSRYLQFAHVRHIPYITTHMIHRCLSVMYIYFDTARITLDILLYN